MGESAQGESSGLPTVVEQVLRSPASGANWSLGFGI